MLVWAGIMKKSITPAFWKSNSPRIARGLIVVWIGVSILVRRWTPSELENALSGSPYRCPLKWWTGLQCAFCGMTHSWIAMFRGDLATAQRENFFGPALWFFALLILLILSLGRRIPREFSHPRLIMLVVIGLTAYAVIRNLHPKLNS